MYLYTDPIAYTGEFITSVVNTDYDKGLWIFNEDGTVVPSYNGIEYSNQDIIVNYNQKLILNSGNFKNIILKPLFVYKSDEWHDTYPDITVPVCDFNGRYY